MQIVWLHYFYAREHTIQLKCEWFSFSDEPNREYDLKAFFFNRSNHLKLNTIYHEMNRWEKVVVNRKDCPKMHRTVSHERYDEKIRSMDD